MHLIRIGKVVINMDLVTDIEINPHNDPPPSWKVGVNFAAMPSDLGACHRVFEGHDAAILMDWLRRNVQDVQDWRAEKERSHAHD